mmetsp:Transcript_61499/g.141799  ORF Transcript_61499/g.141799 Transcript_61499/m.141799 type:complete len:823 (-) Transcript_61499:4-2472(-)
MPIAVDFVAASQPRGPGDDEEQWWEVLDQKTSQELAALTQLPFELSSGCRQLDESLFDDPLCLLLSNLLGNGRHSGAPLPWRNVPGARQLRRALQKCHGAVTDRGFTSPAPDAEQRYLDLAAAHSEVLIERDRLSELHRDLLREQCRHEAELDALKKCLRSEVQRRQSAEERLKGFEFDLDECQSKCLSYERQMRWLHEKHVVSCSVTGEATSQSHAARGFGAEWDEDNDRTVPRVVRDELDALRRTCRFEPRCTSLHSTCQDCGEHFCSHPSGLVLATASVSPDPDVIGASVLEPADSAVEGDSELSVDTTYGLDRVAECRAPVHDTLVLSTGTGQLQVCMRVRVISAHALRTPLSKVTHARGARVSFSRPDPYVRLTVICGSQTSNEIRATAALPSTSEPHWDQCFDFVVPERDQPRLHAQVLNYRTDGEHECLGWVVVPCSNHHQASPFVLPLEGALSQGCLSFSIEFLPAHARKVYLDSEGGGDELCIVKNSPGDGLARRQSRAQLKPAVSLRYERATQTEIVAVCTPKCCGAAQAASLKDGAVQTHADGDGILPQKFQERGPPHSAQRLGLSSRETSCAQESLLTGVSSVAEPLSEELDSEWLCHEELEDQLVRLALELANSVPRCNLEHLERRHAALEVELRKERSQREQRDESVSGLTAEVLHASSSRGTEMPPLSPDSGWVAERRTSFRSPGQQSHSDNHSPGDFYIASALQTSSKQHDRYDSAACCSTESALVSSSLPAVTPVADSILACSDDSKQFRGLLAQGEIGSGIDSSLDLKDVALRHSVASSVHFQVARHELLEIRKECCASRNVRL